MTMLQKQSREPHQLALSQYIQSQSPEAMKLAIFHSTIGGTKHSIRETDLRGKIQGPRRKGNRQVERVYTTSIFPEARAPRIRNPANRKSKV